MSFGEPIALRVHAELERAAASSVAAVPAGARSSSEAQFIEKLRSGDAAAFDQLVTERTSDIYALLFRLTQDPDEARDLTQETFLQAFRHVERFRGDADLRTWLYRIAVNQARNRWRWWRRRRREATVSLDGGEREDDRSWLTRLADHREADPEQRVLAREREQALLTALRALGRQFREVVLLRDVEGLSYEEVAATLSISVGTVKSRLSRARLELRKKLERSL